MYAINIDNTCRILSATYSQYANDNYIIVEDLPVGDITDYLYINGEFVYNPLPVPEVPQEEPTAEQRIAELEEALQLLLSGVVE